MPSARQYGNGDLPTFIDAATGGPDVTVQRLGTLDVLAQWCGTDKSSLSHGYCLIYEDWFESLRQQPITLLELGVYTGASMWLWRGYFPLATIIGVDRQAILGDLPPDVHVLQCEQDAADLPDLVAQWIPLDIVIDDCSHIFDKTIASFDLLFDRIGDGGLYIIEDIPTYDRAMVVEFIDRVGVDYSLYVSATGPGKPWQSFSATLFAATPRLMEQ